MFVERLSLTNFSCFRPSAQSINLSSGLTAFVGANGSGKTAAMDALLRLFGLTSEQRRVRRQDFHVSATESVAPTQRELAIETILAFPELDSDDADHTAVPEFFHQMATDDKGRLKCRMRIQATWTDDGSLDGAIEQKFWAVRTLGAFEEKDCVELKQVDRARIQMIYVPASRDAVTQVAAFLRGRLWRAILWSQGVKTAFDAATETLNNTFASEVAVEVVTSAIEKRWREVQSAGTDTKILFRPVDPRFQEFIRKVAVVFHPDEFGRDRSIEDLSDGQRSLFYLAMTAATLDVEATLVQDSASGFQADSVHIPSLTLMRLKNQKTALLLFIFPVSSDRLRISRMENMHRPLYQAIHQALWEGWTLGKCDISSCIAWNALPE